MAYVDQSNDPRRRATAIVGVAVIHAAIGLGVVAGMTVVGVAPIPKIWKPVLLTPDPTPTPTPTPPETKPTEEARTSTVVVPKPPITDLPRKPIEDVPVDDPFKNVTTGNGPVIGPTPSPSPTPAPTFAPRFARPSNDRNGWISNDDYPSGALRSGAEGIVTYNLIVSTTGRVSACTVTRSSGNSQLDQATCRLIERRARFEPATDGSGAKVVGPFSGTVRWQIPD